MCHAYNLPGVPEILGGNQVIKKEKENETDVDQTKEPKHKTEMRYLIVFLSQRPHVSDQHKELHFSCQRLKILYEYTILMYPK